MSKIPQERLAALRPLEEELRIAVYKGQADQAIQLALKIQTLFDDRRHHRLLKNKLWAFEAALEENRLEFAESGFQGIRQLSNEGTRIHLEASSLLAICYLRQKKSELAKDLIRYVMFNINNIKSDQRRNQFQKRLIARIEEECLLAELIGTEVEQLDPSEIHRESIYLIQHKSDDEIIELIGQAVPRPGLLLLHDIRKYSIKLLPAPDRKFLPAPEEAEKPASLGKKTLAIVRRIGWKAFCDEGSELYALWSQKVPEVFDKKYFATSLLVSMAQWKIGIPMIATGVLAIAMKSTAQVFCEIAKPRTMMIDIGENDLV